MKPFGVLLIALTTLFPAYQLFLLPNVTDQIALFSQYLGLAALILMAWGQIVSTRLPGLENVFGGLDRIYVFHKWLGISAMVALLLHDTIDAEMRGLGPQTGLNELGETLGEISLYGLLILVVISIAVFIPYHLWKWTHKAMGALFAVGAVHFILIQKPFAMIDPAGLYTGLFCVAGVLAYLWMLLPDSWRPLHLYRIDEIEETGGALAVSLTPQGRGLRALPGQFGVFRFTGAGLAEPHPFSFSKLGEDGELRVTIKDLGDFTHALPSAVSPGQEVLVQGPFGRFRSSPKSRQVWIAGGIGVTPFLAWAAALPSDAAPVDFFYCVRSAADAPHLAELRTLDKPNMHLHVVSSSTGARLTADEIATHVGEDLKNAKISFCGPVSLRESLARGLKVYGVKRIKYEEFEFRSGLGLRKLLAKITGQSIPALQRG